MVQGRIFVLLLAGFSLFPYGTAGQEAFQLSDLETLQVRAQTIRLSPDFQTVTATGAVFFHVGPLEIHGDAATLSLEAQTVFIRHAALLITLPAVTTLTADRMLFDIKNRRLFFRDVHWQRESLAPFDIHSKGGLCQNGTCLFRDVRSPLCAHSDAGYEWTVDRVVIFPSGALDARGIHLSLHDKRTISMPFLHLRPPGKPGFSTPNLAFDPEGGWIVGPSGIIPLDDNAYLEGSVALRSRQGFESRTHLHAAQTDLQIDQLFIAPKNLLRYRLKTAQPKDGVFFGTDIDFLQADRRIIDDLTTDYQARAVTHTVSRVRLSGQNDIVQTEAALEAQQHFNDPDGFAHLSPSSPAILLSASMPTVPMGGGFLGTVHADLLRRGLWNDEIETTAPVMIPAHTRLAFETGLSQIQRIGPLVVDVDLATRHQKWLVDDPVAADPGLHLFGGALRIAAPLFRDFDSTRHVLTPFVTYRITPVAWGHTPAFIVDHLEMLRTGHGIETGIRTTLGKHNIETIRLDVYERIALMGLKGTLGPSYLAFRGRFGPPNFYLALDGAWDQRNQTISVLGFSVHRALDRASLDVGARRMGMGDGPHRDQPFATSFLPWLAASLPENAAPSVEVFQEGEVPITRRFRLFLGARGEVYPLQTLHALWYGIKLQSNCGCLALTLTASHRVKSPVPDVFASLHLLGW